MRVGFLTSDLYLVKIIGELGRNTTLKIIKKE